MKQGMDKSADYRAELENMQAMALANRVIREFQRTHPLTDAELKTEYDKLVATIPENKSYHAQHILVASEAEAKAALEALKKGKPFAQLAKEKSTDPGSKDNGGDLGWQDARTFVPSFRTALTKLSKGQITAQPVQTQFGWHIIKLDDVRSERNVPQLDQIRPQLTQRIMGERVDQYINSLKSQAKIQQ
ncbi:peptidylprolyl isomerase [Paludibacterium denitrificans]|uniref:peptidylprolyl isomerase n=1 Tax=Paludibacterium denitrificans TaxID=2675226 RepID=UPI001E4DF408|nr:peptidylprolyl isomerase [Paludibacterium denitrificans]